MNEEKFGIIARLALPHLVVIVLIFSYYMALWDSVSDFVLFMDVAPAFLGDFHYVYGPTGQNIFVHGTPSWGYFYSSFFAILLGLLNMLPSPITIWGAMQIVETVVLWLVPLLWIFKERLHRIMWTAAFFLSVPVLHNFSWGQVSGLLLLLTLLAFILGARGRWLAASFCFALAISIKFYPVIFLLFFVLKREWRIPIVTAVICIVLLVLVPAAVLGPTKSVEFIGHVRDGVELNAPYIAVNPNSQYFPTVIQRLIGNDPAVNPHPRLVLSIIGFVVFLGIVVLLLHAWRKNAPGLQWWTVVLLSLGFPFVMATSWPHYFVILPFAQVFLVGAVSASTLSHRARALVTALLLFPSFVLATIPFRHMLYIIADAEENFDRVMSYSIPGFLLWSNVLLLVASAILLLQRHTRK